MKKFLMLSAIAIAFTSVVSAQKTVVDIAVGSESHTTLVAAVKAADLVATLQGAGPFTVFAPTNAAFTALDTELQPGGIAGLSETTLTNVLLYHVNDGSTLESSLTTSNPIVNSLLGKSNTNPTGVTKRIVTRGNDRFINGSKIIATNVRADNGIVHVIDRVLLASGADIANTAIFFAQGNGFVNPELSYLVEAVIYADLVAPLADANNNFTVFAPTNQAFRDLGALLGVPLNQPSDIRKLPRATVAQVLLTHVFNLSGGGKFTSEFSAGTITALNGQNITLGAYNNGYLTVKGNGNATAANMAIPDVQCTNGVVHVIDRVLLPQ